MGKQSFSWENKEMNSFWKPRAGPENLGKVLKHSKDSQNPPSEGSEFFGPLKKTAPATLLEATRALRTQKFW